MTQHAPSDPFDLQRFVTAQQGVFENAMQELRAGRKKTHWMWFVFPQLAGLGSSAAAQRYAISSKAEARAYLAHEVLGARLQQAMDTLLHVRGRTAHDIFGSPDDMKLRSCATLFATVSEPGSVSHQVLEKYYGDLADERTLELLSRQAAAARRPS